MSEELSPGQFNMENCLTRAIAALTLRSGGRLEITNAEIQAVYARPDGNGFGLEITQNTAGDFPFTLVSEARPSSAADAYRLMQAQELLDAFKAKKIKAG